MGIMHEKWMQLEEKRVERRSPDRAGFTLTDAQVDAVDDTAGLPPVQRAGRERASEHAWINQF
jgi:hypothetical protein